MGDYGLGDKPPETELVHYTELGEEYVVVKMQASALNYSDLSMMTHVYQIRPPPPFALGTSGAGEIIHVGPKASYDNGRGVFPPPKLGDRVFVSSRFNCHSSRIAARGTNCTPMPENFDFDDAAGYGSGMATSYLVLVARLNVQKGEWVVITGATGTIGLGGVQICKKLGARVIALGSDTRNTGRLEVVKKARSGASTGTWTRRSRAPWSSVTSRRAWSCA